MNKWLRTFWHWLRQRIGVPPPSIRPAVQIISVRRVQPIVARRPTCPVLSGPPTRIETARAVTAPVEVLPADPSQQPNRASPTAKTRSMHVDRQQLVIRSLEPNEPLDTNVETWERRGNSFLVNEARTRVVTGNKALVSPQQITGFCSRCGKADLEFFTCSRTGVQLCRACVSFFPHLNGPIPVSLEAARALRLHLSGWELHDLEFGCMEPGAFSQMFPYLH
jgi:hypothetical protein